MHILRIGEISTILHKSCAYIAHWRNKYNLAQILCICARSKFWGVSGSEDRGGGDNSIQFINIGREGDKSFKEWQRKIGGGELEGWVTTVF